MSLLKITLPLASPERYLEWMRYWREVEAVMLDHPRLAELAGRESGAAFIREPLADYISHELIPQIVDAAEQALPGPAVSPELEVDADRAQDVVTYIARRTRWLEEPGVQKALGVQPLAPRIVDLRMRVLVTVRDQITSYMIRGGAAPVSHR